MDARPILPLFLRRSLRHHAAREAAIPPRRRSFRWEGAACAGLGLSRLTGAGCRGAGFPGMVRCRHQNHCGIPDRQTARLGAGRPGRALLARPRVAQAGGLQHRRHAGLHRGRHAHRVPVHHGGRGGACHHPSVPPRVKRKRLHRPLRGWPQAGLLGRPGNARCVAVRLGVAVRRHGGVCRGAAERR